MLNGYSSIAMLLDMLGQYTIPYNFHAHHLQESWLEMLKNKFKKERIPLVNPDVEYHRTKHGKKRLSSVEDNSARQPPKKAMVSSACKSAVYSHYKCKLWDE